MNSDRAFRWSLVLIAALALSAGVVAMDSLPVGVFHDDAMYVILAKSLATGHGYRYLNIPGTPTASHFPPGYPGLLALVWHAAPSFPGNVAIFKAINVACFSLSAVLVTVLARTRVCSAPWAAFVGALSAVSVPLLVLVTMVLSEPLFLVLLLAVLIAADSLFAAEPALARVAALGAAIGVITLVRTHGIVVLPALAIPLMLRRRFREAAMCTMMTLAVLLPWQLWTTSQAGVLPAPLEGNYGSYLGWWVRGAKVSGPHIIPATLARTVPEVGAMLAALFSPWRSATAHHATMVVLALLVAAGSWSLRHRAPVTLLFLAGYTVIVLVWPFPPSRFVWGIWPLFLFLLTAPAATLVRTPDRTTRAGRAAVVLALLWISVGYARYEVRAIRGRWWGSISRAAAARIEPAVAWTLRNTRPSDIVASDDEGAVYLYTGRLAVPVASFTTEHYLGQRTAEREASEGLQPLLAAYAVQHVLVGTRRTFDAAAFLASSPTPLLELRQEFQGGAAFSVVRP